MGTLYDYNVASYCLNLMSGQMMTAHVNQLKMSASNIESFEATHTLVRQCDSLTFLHDVFNDA